MGLRDFLEQYEIKRPDKVLRIKKPIDTRYEITELQRKLDTQKKYPIIIVERPITYQGKESEFMLVTNLMASREICADMLGINPTSVALEYSKRTASRIEPVIVSKDDAPCKEIIKKDDEIDLFEFPIQVHNFMDPGPYIGSGYVTTVPTESAIDNCALQRMWVKSPRKLGYWAHTKTHNYYNMMDWWSKGKDMPVAIWIGHHPAALSGAQSKLGYPESHYPAMGGILGEPIKLVETELFGDLIKVPAEAEIVIEGYVPKEVFEAEGPFGEYTGYTGPQRPSPIIEVKCVTYRKNAIYHGIGVGLADHLVGLGNFPMEARIYETLRKNIPEVINVYVPVSGRRNHLYVQVKKTRPGIGKDVIAAALAIDHRVKHVFVVDEDVNLFDEEEILWSVAYRSQWHKDLVIIEGMTTSALDPSLDSTVAIGTKGGIDCTMPPPFGIGLPRAYQQRNIAPQDVREKVKLEDYLTAEQIRRFCG